MSAKVVRSLTFLFTDVEGSTRLWQDSPDAMSRAIARHDVVLAACISEAGGDLVKSGSRGDGALAVFSRAADAISCAADIQRAFLAEAWPDGAQLRLRAAVHSGEAETRDDDYFGPTLSRAARLMSIAHGGQALASAAAVEAAKDGMPPGITLIDLGHHLLKDLTQPERVAQIVAAGLPRDFPPLASANARACNLPTPPTTFVGRDAEQRDLVRLLDAARLVTLTGVGGAGKTRLAVETAAAHAASYRDGVTFVDLSAVRDPLSVASVIVTACDIRDPMADAAIDEPGAGARALTGHLVRVLREQDLLLVIDNCEHVVDECSRIVGALIAGAPAVHVLATSREPLAVAGEQVYSVPPLAPPSDTDASTDTQLEDVGSVRLFCDRARAARSSFQLTAENRASVAEICRQLDGIPLAIELAAARVSMLAPAQIAARLTDAPELLSTLGRDVVDRHKTLEGAMAWSYDLLEPDEQVLLCRLSIFTGGWSLDSAEAVCGHAPLLPESVFELLARLVDRSLVAVADDSIAVRYRLLEPVRQFAERKLLAASEASTMRDRHCAWFVRQAGDEAFMLYTSEPRLAELRSELDNFRAAMRWSIAAGDATSALRIATPLNGVFVWQGQRAEADAWLNEALALDDTTVSDLRASAIGTLAANLDLSGDVRRAVELQRQASEMFEELGNRSSLLWSQIYLGHSLHFRAEYDEEDEAYRRAHQLADEVGDKVARALIPFLRSWFRLARGDVAGTRDLQDQVLEAGSGEHVGVSIAVDVFEGLGMFIEGRHEEGSRYCDAPIERLLRELVDAAGNADPMGLWSLQIAGVFELTQPSTMARGRERLAELLPGARRTGLIGAFPDAFESIAAIAADEDRHASSAQMFGAAHRLRQSTGIEMRYDLTQPMIKRAEAADRSALGDAEYTVQWTSGAAMPLPEAIDLAASLL